MPNEPAPNSNEPTPTPSLVTAGTTPPAPTESTPSEFKPDPGKTEAENAAAKTAWEAEQATKGKAPEETPEQKAAKETETKNKVSKENPFKVEELKLPEGFTIDEPTSKGFVEIVNKFGLPRDAVAELVALQANAMKVASEKGVNDWNNLRTEWQSKIKSDPDFGGDKVTVNQAAIGQLLTKYGDDEVRHAFDLTDAGNHPAIFRFLSKIAKDLVEPGPRPVPTPPSPARSAADILYGDTQGKAA